MGNTTGNTNSGNSSSTKTARNDRPYSIDVYGGGGSLEARRGDSPRGDERAFDFATSNSNTIGGSSTTGRRRPVLCYQNSSDYGNEDTIEDFKNHVSSTSHGINAFNDQMLPTVFKWDGGGKEVYITGTFSEWKPLKMVPSQGDFVTVVDIPEGVHKYKFLVDGIETVDKNSAMDEGQDNNVLNVKKSDFEVFEALANDLASNTANNGNNSNSGGGGGTSNNTALSGSPPGSYTQEIPTTHLDSNNSSGNSASTSGPPILPPHLLQVILNNPSVNFGEPTLLPQPNHVMLNHLYALSIKDGVMVLSAIHRYRKKYVTTLLYKPI